MFAQLMFWGVLDGQERKASYTKDVLQGQLRELQGREPVSRHYPLLTYRLC
jgi:hypothetical protein